MNYHVNVFHKNLFFFINFVSKVKTVKLRYSKCHNSSAFSLGIFRNNSSTHCLCLPLPLHPVVYLLLRNGSTLVSVEMRGAKPLEPVYVQTSIEQGASSNRNSDFVLKPGTRVKSGGSADGQNGVWGRIWFRA